MNEQKFKESGVKKTATAWFVSAQCMRDGTAEAVLFHSLCHLHFFKLLVYDPELSTVRLIF